MAAIPSLMRLLEYHQTLLRDQPVQQAYRDAIGQAIKGGEAVLDLGAGTGVHSLFACQAGARVVYAVEQTSVIELARKLCQANGCSDRVRFIHDRAQDVVLPERVDVVFGHHGLDELMELMPLARDRFLKPGGTMIPSRVELFAAPMESAAAWKKAVSLWERPLLGADLAAGRSFAVNERHEWHLTQDELLGQAVLVGEINFSSAADSVDRGTGETTVTRKGLLHGLGFWKVQWLTPEISLATTPPCELSADVWANIFLPIEEPVPVEAGEGLKIRVHTGRSSWGHIWKWEVELLDRSGEVRTRFAHSNLSTELLGRDGPRTQPLDHNPGLTRRGTAVRFVLDSCDGERSLKWIEEELLRRFPQDFASPGDAAGLVARVVSKYAK